MPTICAVYGCTYKTNNKNVSFYRFPKKKHLVQVSSFYNELFLNKHKNRICRTYLLVFLLFIIYYIFFTDQIKVRLDQINT